MHYVWPQQSSGKVYNALLFRTQLSYNVLSGKLSSPFNEVKNCDIRQGFCVTGNDILVWDIPRQFHCPLSDRKFESQVLLHYNPSGILFEPN